MSARFLEVRRRLPVARPANPPGFLSFLTVRPDEDLKSPGFSEKTVADINCEMKLLKVCFIQQNL